MAGGSIGDALASSAESFSFVSRSTRSFFSFFSLFFCLSFSTLSECPVGVPFVLVWGRLEVPSFGVTETIGDVAARGDLTSFGRGEAGFSVGTGVEPLVGGFATVLGNDTLVELGVCATVPGVAERR